MNRIRLRPRAAGLAAALAAAIAAPVTACGGSGSAPPAVPSLSQSAPGGQATAGTAGGARASALHAAAQCIRQHGIPGYADPVLTPSGQVYSDSRSFQNASQSVLDAVRHACAALIATAGLSPMDEPPAPPQLVQAGVRAAECLRAHGLPKVTDPTARSQYTPGHGFGVSASEGPAGGKQNPVWQHAIQACVAQVTAEIQASTLGSLSNDG
ncbi:hypothetical protein EAS64_15200 [Trebonia kvetii]|uniref:Lipoprotein n=1 Tax=Trebonia kvetii TaxID=2480626 RepID=A0A6P2C022_9ACTN|nr:hypothetical protein [Trebonia kvetii]TVZ03805.1 hypothetical protein EAS64_15200 [Trebonia kvetii]